MHARYDVKKELHTLYSIQKSGDHDFNNDERLWGSDRIGCNIPSDDDDEDGIYCSQLNPSTDPPSHEVKALVRTPLT